MPRRPDYFRDYRAMKLARGLRADVVRRLREVIALAIVTQAWIPAAVVVFFALLVALDAYIRGPVGRWWQHP